MFIKTLRSNRDRHRVEGSASANASWQENMLRREVEVCMRQTDRFDPHPFITRNLVCYGDIEVPTTGKNGKMFFIMSPDLGHGGELFEYLCFQERPYVKNFDEACARRIIRQLVDAIAYLHEKVSDREGRPLPLLSSITSSSSSCPDDNSLPFCACALRFYPAAGALHR